MTNRRRFLEGLVATPLIGACSHKARSGTPMRYAYAGRLGCDGHDSIEVFRIDGNRWRLLQTVASRAPAALAVHPARSVLYAANAVAVYEGLPRGTVEVFAINRVTGALSLLQRRALSLSATEPRSLAVSPDGRYLAVASYGGGAYNVIAIEQDGTLGPITHIFKEIGSGAHSVHQAAAHPHTVLFDLTGRLLLSSDTGCDHLNVFAVNADGELERRSKVPVRPGAGPGAITLDRQRSVLRVRKELDQTISFHRYRTGEGTIEEAFRSIETPAGQTLVRSVPSWLFVPVI